MGKYEVTHGPLNVRCKPGANAKVVRKIREGKIIKVYKFWNEWANIGICQWVDSSYLRKLLEYG